MTDFRNRRFYTVFKKAFKTFFERDLDTYAAALAFQMLIAVFPFLIVFIAALGLFDLSEFYRILYEHAGAIVPGDATDLVDQVIDEIRQPAGGWIPFVFIIALWLASSAWRSASHALNIAYKVEEDRPFWSQFLLSFAYTLVLLLMLILALALMALGPQAMEWLAGLIELDDFFVAVWGWLRWAVILVIMMTAVGFIYSLAPNISRRLRFITPGSVFAVLVWVGVSMAFDFYMRTFVDLSILYGSIGAIIFLLLYFYISAVLLLLGAELNWVIEGQKKGQEDGG